MRGTMRWFNEVKGYGVIATEDEERLRVDTSGFAGGAPPDGPRAGLPVAFVVTEAEGVRKAEEVVLLPEIVPRRARMRRGGGGR